MTRSWTERPGRLVAMILAAGVVGAGASASAAPGKSVLYIQRAAVPGGSADEAVRAHLTASGYRVTVNEGLVDQTDPCAFDLVILSSTVRSNQYTGDRAAIARLRDTGAPLLTWENDLLDDLRLTAMRRDADFGELETGHYAWLVRAPHPLSAGLPAGMTTWTEARTPAGWGRPGLGADIIMTVPGEPEKAMLFGYERGATMDYDFVAPARRVFIGLENASFDKLNDTGRKLFDAAVAWSAAGAKACGTGKAG
jgi:hypothetical protein